MLARLRREVDMLRDAAAWKLAFSAWRGLRALWRHARRRGGARAARAQQEEALRLASLALAIERWVEPIRRAERLSMLSARVGRRRSRRACRRALALLRRPAALTRARRRFEALSTRWLLRRCWRGLRAFSSVQSRYSRLLGGRKHAGGERTG